MSGCVFHASPEVDYIVERVQVIPMNSSAVLRNRAVVIDNGKIIKIIKQSAAVKVNAAQRVDGEGRYLMPGLADMHVHVRWNPQQMFNLFLVNGVTTIANMRLKDGGFDHLELREKINSGAMLGPRYLLSGPHLEGDFPGSIEEVGHVLDEHARTKIDFVKVHGDLKPDIYQAIIIGARQRGLKVVGHAQHRMPLKNSLALNALEHMEEFLYVALDEKLANAATADFLPTYRANVDRLLADHYRAEVIDEVAESNVYIDPTLIVYKMVGVWQSDEHLSALKNNPDLRYLPDEVKEFWLNPATNPYQEKDFPITKAEVDKNLQVMLRLTKELHDKGVPMLSGTDTFGTLVPGISLHEELAMLVEAGLSPFEALQCSTVNVAAYLGEAGKAGVIQAGARADFILLDKNPLLDIRNSRSVSGVFTHGKWLSRDLLAEH
ncbi:Amidohydrolase family enzyme [Cellvibrio sp. BR]|nr:Amidohydrolase family enzyme [Cellvibrio sp. BR]